MLSEYSYEYLLNGYQAKKTDNTGKVTNYTYDGLGRITKESTTGQADISYTYDDSNNRETMSVGDVTTTYKYDKDNRLLIETTIDGGISKITRYGYDGNGNQIYTATETISPAAGGEEGSFRAAIIGKDTETANIFINEYDGFNRLVKTSTGDVIAQYRYNADGLRRSKEVNGSLTAHIWDGDQIVLELNGSGAVMNKYIRGINLIYSMDGTDANIRYFLYNGHGDTVQLTDNSGNVVKFYDYDAFGNEKNIDNNDNNSFRYCGEYFDKETGTYYLRARYYDPATSRMLTEDSYPVDIMDPLSLNLYTCCGNNPIRYYDPSGHFWVEIWGGIKSATRTTIHAGDWVASNVLRIDTAAAGAVILDMNKDSKGVYHASFDCWQAKFGYNDSYDFFFDLGTSMNKAKFQFRSGDQDYNLWAWKGDYINLGAGAEFGIYKRMTVAGYDTPQWAVDKSLAMTMTMNLKDNKGNTIISYAPSDKQWWITGFNPAYKNVQASSLTASYAVTFNNRTMYNDFLRSLDPDETRWVFDDKKYIATFTF